MRLRVKTKSGQFIYLRGSFCNRYELWETYGSRFTIGDEEYGTNDVEAVRQEYIWHYLLLYGIMGLLMGWYGVIIWGTIGWLDGWRQQTRDQYLVDRFNNSRVF